MSSKSKGIRSFRAHLVLRIIPDLGMLKGMSIHIKDWSMIPSPASKPRLQQGGIQDLARANANMAQRIQESGATLLHIAKEQEEVQRLGNEAKFEKNLDLIAQESAEELGEQSQIEHWDESWNKTHTPRVQALLEELPQDKRESYYLQALKHSQRASIQAQAVYHKTCINEAKENWNGLLQDSQQEGKGDRAHALLQSGAGVFYPENQKQKEEQKIASSTTNLRWQRLIQDSPLDALSLYQQANTDDLPNLREHQEQLQNKMRQLKKSEQLRINTALTQCILSDEPYAMPELERAAQSGLIDKQILENITHEGEASTALELCRWFQRIDEADYGDPESLFQLQFEVASSALTRHDKRQMMRRAEHSMSLPQDQRLAVSRKAWKLYEQGYLGSHVDERSLVRLNQLQSSGIATISRQADKGLQEWSQDLDQNLDSWVCFSPNA